eukprot:6978723-Ditylum_brightwellii.AAC.1
MKPFVCAIHPKLGFNRNTERQIIYSAMKYNSFQLAHLHLEQGFLAVKHLIGHIQEGALTGMQIMIALSKVQLISGTGQPFLEEATNDRSYVPSNWLSTIRTFFHMCSTFISILEAWIIKRKKRI